MSVLPSHRKGHETLDRLSCFKAKKLFPSLDCATRKSFIGLDSDLSSKRGGGAQAQLERFLASGVESSGHVEQRIVWAREALRFLQSLPTGTFPTTANIMQANAILCGREVRALSWRREGAWIGRVDRVRSVWVGAHPAEIPRMMALWNGILQRPEPVSLRLAVALLRFLQIHPFVDGNGRAARWIALAMARGSGALEFGLQVAVMSVWAQGASFRQAASASVDEDDEWSLWFDEWIRVARGSA